MAGGRAREGAVMASDLTVRVVQSNAELESCFALRMRVFVDEQGVPPWEEVDHYDETATHFAAVRDGVVVGTARMVEKGEGLGKIGRVAVEESARGTGIGRELMVHVLTFSRGRVDTLALDAQLYVIPFYEMFGFQAE